METQIVSTSIYPDFYCIYFFYLNFPPKNFMSSACERHTYNNCIGFY